MQNYQHQKTDNFLTSIEKKNANEYHLSLNLELLRGCQYSCKGCGVNKFAANPLKEDDAYNLLTWVKDMETNGMCLPTVVFIAPTDFLSADNTKDVLMDPRVWAVVSRFKRLSLSTTCLSLEGAEEIAKILKDHYGHMELEINIVMEPEHIETDKYLRTVKENRDKLYDLLDWDIPIKSFCIMNVYEYEKIKKENIKSLLNDYKVLHEKIKHLFDTTIDFNFSMSRDKSRKSSDIKEAIIKVTEMFDTSVNYHNSQFIRFSFGKLTDCLIEKHYNWINGEWYVSPLLYDRYAAFVEELKIPLVNYTAKETEAFEEALLINQYENADKKESCGGCEYLGSCVDRNILKVMDIYNIKECIIAKDALDIINKNPG